MSNITEDENKMKVLREKLDEAQLLRTEKENLESTLKKIEDEYGSTFSKVDDYKSKVKLLKNDLDKYNHALNENDLLIKDISEKENSYDDRCKKISELKEEENKLNTVVNPFDKKEALPKIDEIKNEIKKLSDTNNKIDITELKNERKKLEKENLEFNCELERINTEIQQKKDEIEKLEETIQDVNVKINELKEAIKESKEKIFSIKNYLQNNYLEKYHWTYGLMYCVKNVEKDRIFCGVWEPDGIANVYRGFNGKFRPAKNHYMPYELIAFQYISSKNILFENKEDVIIPIKTLAHRCYKNT